MGTARKASESKRSFPVPCRPGAQGLSLDHREDWVLFPKTRGRPGRPFPSLGLPSR